MTAPATRGADASTWRIWRRLLGYSGRHWGWAILALIGMIIDAACMTLFARLIQPLLDDLFVNKDPYVIFWMPIWLVVIFGLRGIASYWADYGTAVIGRNVVHRLRLQVFARYLGMPDAFFSSEPSGQQISRITYTTEQVAQAATNAVKVAVIDGLTVIGMVGVMLYNSAYLTMALLVLVPAVVLVATVVSRRYRRISRRVQGSMGSVTGTVEEAVAGHREVKIFGAQQQEAERLATVDQQTLRLNLKIASTNGYSTGLVQTLAAVALALIVYLATRPDVIDHMSPGTFFSVIAAMGAILPSLKRLTTVQPNLQRGVAAAEDVFAVIDQPPEVDAGNRELSRARGEIELRQVRMRYPAAEQYALDEVSLHCAAGSVTALVGRSGSGKSSLAALLPRLNEPESGSVLLDGHPLDDYSLVSLRRQIAWVGQRVVLFEGSVAENIAYGELRGASREAIREAARAANALDFIERLPQGFDSPLGSGGSALSGGERQRIAIARAILKDAPILILDEATSALDSESERLIQQALARLMQERTTLVIAHRLSTIEHADNIVVLDRGRIIEQGRHVDLLAANGAYAALHRLQFGDAVPARD